MSDIEYRINIGDRSQRQEHLLMRSWGVPLEEMSLTDLRHQDRVRAASRVIVWDDLATAILKGEVTA